MAFSEEKIKLYQIEDILFSNIQQTPTTLAGYGITNAWTRTQADGRYVRYDGSQTLTELQKQTARENIGALGGEGHPALTLGIPNGLSLNITTQIISLATASQVEASAMSAADKIKLDGIAVNANNYVHPTQGILDTGTLSGKQVVSRVAFNTLGHITALDIRSNLPYVDFTSAETITGLKTIRRAGANDGSSAAQVLGFEIGNDNLYKMWIMNSQNVRSLSGEVNWFFRMRELYGTGGTETAYNHDRIGFHRGGITVIGDSLPSADISTELESWVNANFATGSPYAISTYIHRNVMVSGRGYFGKSSLADTLFLGSDDMLFSGGTVYAAKGLRTADADNPTTIFDGSVVFIGSVSTGGPGSPTHKMRIRHNNVLYDVALTAV
jgi:hypothetical protein